jgi:hypothetical protein
VTPDATIALLRQWLARALPADAMQWLDDEIARQEAGADERRLGIALGLASRKLGRAELKLGADDIATAQQLRPGWQPQSWSAAEAARVVLWLATYNGDDAGFAARVDKLAATAEVTELVACLKGFAVFPAPAALYARAREGARSSIGAVFEAIACNNPYPRDHFDEAAWNQLVVKCVFVGAPIETIVGVAGRRNPELLEMLRDLVAERSAAGRALSKAVHEYVEDGWGTRTKAR